MYGVWVGIGMGVVCTPLAGQHAFPLALGNQFPATIDRGTQLSAQQQGQILSDIQQHHRFSLQPSQQNFPEPSFSRHHQLVSQSGLYNQQPLANQASQQQPTLQFAHQNPQFLNPSQNSALQNNQFSSNQFLTGILNPLSQLSISNPLPQLPLFNQQVPLLPTNAPTQTPLNSPPALPTVAPSLNPVANSNRVIQHHTQTSFEPNYASQTNQARIGQQLHDPVLSYGNYQQAIKPRPTIDPIVAIEQQIKSLDPEKHKQKIKELREKQAIIEKHNQFVERQYQKALKKAQEDHEVFVEQQNDQKKEVLHKPPGTENLHYSRSSLPRYIYPEEVSLFGQAVKQYYEEHPTTTTTTTTTLAPTTTTQKSTKRDRVTSFLPTALPSVATKVKAIQSLDDLDQLQKEYKSQKIRKDDLLEQLRLAIGRNSDGDSIKNLTSREISINNANDKNFPNGKEEELTLPNGEKVTVIRADNSPTASSSDLKPDEITLPSGQRVQVFKTTDPKLIPGGNSEEQEITLPNGQKAQIIKTTQPKLVAAASAPKPVYKTEEITLPDGQRVEIIKTSDPSLVPGGVKLEPGSELEKLVLSRTTTTTTIKPPKAVLEELTKSVPGSNFELLKTGASGGLESVGKSLPNQKRVTFVLLEEQSDGTLKVQGIKGNGKDKPEIDVDSILKKIKTGEIKLPKKSEDDITVTKSVPSTTYKPLSSVTVSPNAFASNNEERFNKFSSLYAPTTAAANTKTTLDTAAFTSEDIANVPILKTNIGTQIRASSTPASINTKHAYSSSIRSTTPRLTSDYYRSNSNSNPTRTPHILNHNQNDLIKQASTVSSLNQNSIPTNSYNSATHRPKTTKSDLPASVSIYQSVSPTQPTTIEYQDAHPTQEIAPQQLPKAREELPNVLKSNGLFAMAKFLRQSGLDTILNETGPYTIFVPTDRAFRTLLVQLGGPEKAEEKFRENPRLLSGLLLHHVIPGSFNVASLQDEMTGVSLAGTQLRVNLYNMHDLEWNDVKITTINGAKVMDEKKDIKIPQGTAHTIDRVMFPLPVGDIVQTLQSDRERRFTSFLRAIFASGLAETLQGPKTFTLFAPTEKAFAGLSSEDLSKTVSDKVLARELVLRHLMAGTIYTNGMRYYQIKDSLLPDRQLTFSKQGGKKI
ncbi:hypothetical protein NQ317_015665 [Molorchus minor]|uniref:FAS1 domain-containing protein n=1 Tax=Molorchus minor TaxID=1323400 RepID=A0ABQ9J5X9_9CUCU|nr:hypothetical protein NQ317_015665 [Molorchus minor]